MLLFEILACLSDHLLCMILHISPHTSFPKPLSQAEEQVLVEEMLSGSESAREKLIEHNLRLAAHISKKYAGSGLDPDDLVSIGTIGLIKAVSTFRPEAGKLSTYASRCIENEILMAIRANRKNKNNVLLGEPIGTDKEGNEINLVDILGTEPDVVPEEAELAIESRRVSKLIVTSLDGREREVVQLRFGLNGEAPMAQKDVAKKLGISRSYVSRIEKRAIEKLREAMQI